jgi:DNA-binding transcriptional LysR family regulator
MYEELFSERGLSLERLKVLVEVHDAGSIAGTAPGNAIRHSQYSRQLRELSEFFGREMTHRLGKVLKLTQEGASLAELVRPFLRGLADFRTECRNERQNFSIASGDSIIQWLVIPKIGNLTKTLPDVRFTSLSLRTNEIVQQIFDARVDFGLIRKNAVAPGLKCLPLGNLAYVAVIPAMMVSGKSAPTFSQVFKTFPHAMQTTEGQFTKQLLGIAFSQNHAFRPALSCESFPQTVAAVRSGRFAAIVPELAIRDLPTGSFHKLSDASLKSLRRELVLAWNPRVIKVRPHAIKVLTELGAAMKF